MFQSARLKLTTWYLFTAALISVFFSLIIFVGINREFRRIGHFQKLRLEDRRSPDPEIIVQARTRLIMILVMVNLGILSVAGIAGYFLAGRTLKPIEEMIDEQNRFIADSSHELRTPLTSLKSEMEVNLRDKDLTMVNAKKLITSNLEEVNKLQLLSDNLIKLAQYQGNSRSVFENIPLKSTVDNACKKVAAAAKFKRIKISNQVDDCLIEAERNSVEELFVILLDNAIKYSLTGGKVFLTSDKQEGQIMIEIKDNGIGISPIDIPHVFDRFYRGDKSRTKSDISGYGLGLSIAKQIIDRHHGTITVISHLNKGTTFKLSLRLAE